MKILISVVLYLGQQELAICGHDESALSLNRGNLIELVNAMAEFDQELASHLQMLTGVHRSKPVCKTVD